MSHSAGHGRSSRPLIGRSRLGRQPPRIQLEAAEERYKHVVNLWWKVEGSAVPLPEATTVEMDPMRREMGRLSGRVAHIDREKLSDTPNTTQAPPADVERFSNLTVEFKQALDSALIATRDHRVAYLIDRANARESELDGLHLQTVAQHDLIDGPLAEYKQTVKDTPWYNSSAEELVHMVHDSQEKDRDLTDILQEYDHLTIPARGRRRSSTPISPGTVPQRRRRSSSAASTASEYSGGEELARFHSLGRAHLHQHVPQLSARQAQRCGITEKHLLSRYGYAC